MKSILNLVAVCALVAVVGCKSDEANSTASPGAVGEKSCCTEKSDAACCKDKAATTEAASPGAVGEKKSCSEAKQCPMSGKTEGDASMGAVSDEKKSGCCASKSSCASKPE